jgi:sulfur-carrier protein adenylyltransferase/sulfurtransferase
VVAAALAAPAQAGHTPSASFPTLRSDAVKRLLDVKEPVVLVDMRRPAEYRAGHLPGAISLPITELERRYREIPKAARVVLYCQCPLEEMGSVYTFLWNLGYKNHVVLEDGFEGWFKSQYPVVK